MSKLPPPFPFTALPLDQLGSRASPEDTHEPTALPPPRIVNKDGVPFPPGNAGALCEFFYDNALRPVPEIAIVSALGWLAGVSGKAFITPTSSGLNLYVILLARSAIGKEAINSGITTLSRALLNKGYVTAPRFVNFDDMVSGPALRKAVAPNPSFVNISDEFGKKLTRIAHALQSGQDGPMTSLKAEMTSLYHKSGPNSTVGGMAYSKQSENVAANDGVAYSMVGDSTPGTWRKALTDDMMEDGFLSRFTVIEYAGHRPAQNENVRPPSDDLLAWAGGLATQAMTLIGRNTHTRVEFSDQAKKLLANFNDECDRQINKTPDDEPRRAIWNRAQLKALRVACLLAVADNDLNPHGTVMHVNWAIDMEMRQIKLFNMHLDAGDIGIDDEARERKLLKFCKEYLTTTPKGYHIPDAMHLQGVVPRHYFQKRTSSLPAFKSHKMGATAALDMAIRSLCDSGRLMKIDKMKAGDAYGFNGDCYRIVNLPGGLLD